MYDSESFSVDSFSQESWLFSLINRLRKGSGMLASRLLRRRMYKR